MQPESGLLSVALIKIRLSFIRFRNHRTNADHTLTEFVAGGVAFVCKSISAYCNVLADSRLKPVIAVSGNEDGGAGAFKIIVLVVRSEAMFFRSIKEISSSAFAQYWNPFACS